MSDAIRCGQCRWWREVCSYGVCEHSPPVFTRDYMGCDWQQPMTRFDQGCSRGEPKTEEEDAT